MKSPREALQPEAVPQPPPAPRRRQRISLVSIVSGVLSFIIVATVVVGIGWSFAAKRVGAPGPLVADKTVNIPRGDDVPETLESQGVIDNAQLMKAALLLEGNRSNVKAGEYLFRQSASLQDVIDTLVSGKQVLHSLTIPEGLTSLQTVDRMRENDILVGDLKNIPPEGSLMPDTYKFARGTTREQLVRTMQQEAKRVVNDVWANRESATPIHTPYELVTLASIVEKETGKADERPRVAGVFINRLSRNIPLQSDPTIVYGIVGGRGTLGRGILKSEVEQKTPYNTYAIVGLPPGPIANPGRAALEAVANPSKTKDLYFVADGTGGHAFAETLDQHRANVVHWRQIEKDAKDKIVPDADKLQGPSAPGLPGKNQRGDLDGEGDAAFGLVAAFDTPPPAPEPSQTAMAAAMFPLTVPGAADGPEKATASPALYDDQQFDALDVEIGGVRSKDPGTGGELAAAVAAAEPDADATGSVLTFPVSPARQAEMKARAAAYGLPAPERLASAEPVSEASHEARSAPATRPKIFDASEGTSLDPLLDKTYDLNSAKSVPVIKALPALVTSAGK